jgi:hypothetical protein
MELSFLEKPPVMRLLKNFPTYYGTSKFITVFTRTLPLVPILSQINPVHSTTSYLSKIHFDIVAYRSVGRQHGIDFARQSNKHCLARKPRPIDTRLTAWTVFARSKAGIVGSNPTQGMDVCIVFVYSVCVVLWVGRGLAPGWSPVQGVLQTVYRIKKLKKLPRPNKGL